MGILKQSENISGATLSKSKISDYARDYRNEYLFIRGIDTCFKFFRDNRGKADEGIFQNNRVEIIKKKINKLDQAERLGYLSGISNMEIDERDVFYSSSLLEELDNFADYYVDYDDWEFDQERFDRFVDREFQVTKILLHVMSYFIVNLKWYLISIKLFGMIVMMMELIVMILRVYYVVEKIRSLIVIVMMMMELIVMILRVYYVVVKIRSLIMINYNLKSYNLIIRL